MDPYSGPYIVPNSSPHTPLPHSLLSTRELRAFLEAHRFRVLGGSWVVISRVIGLLYKGSIGFRV